MEFCDQFVFGFCQVKWCLVYICGCIGEVNLENNESEWVVEHVLIGELISLVVIDKD